MTTRTDPRTGPRPGRVLGILALALVIGIAWGAATSGLQTVLPWPFEGLANAVPPWVVPSFVVGAVSRRWRVALAAGVLACAGQVLGYYATSALRGFGVSTPMVALWLVAAAPGGLVFAAAGHLWARSPRPSRSGLGAALLACAFLAQGLVTYAWTLGYAGDAVVFCSIGVLLLVLLPLAHPGVRREQGPTTRRRRRRALLRASALWALPVLALGIASQAAVQHVLSQPVDVTSADAPPPVTASATTR